MAWKDNLKNISQPNINITDYTQGADTPEYLIDKNKELAGTWWLNFVSITLFLFGLYAFSKKNGFMQAIMISSYIALMVSLAFILSQWSYAIYPFFLFSIVWIVSIIAIYNGKNERVI